MIYSSIMLALFFRIFMGIGSEWEYRLLLGVLKLDVGLTELR